MLLGWQTIQVAILHFSDITVSCLYNDDMDCQHDQCKVVAISQQPIIYRGFAYWNVLIAGISMVFLPNAINWGTHVGLDFSYGCFLTVSIGSMILFSLFAMNLEVRCPMVTPNSLAVRLVLWTESWKPKLEDVFSTLGDSKVAKENEKKHLIHNAV